MTDDEMDQEIRAMERLRKRTIKELHVASRDSYLIIYALCHDGTLWSRSPFEPAPEKRGWDRVEDIPLDP